MTAVEVATVHHVLPLPVDQRVVVGAVELVLDELAPPGQAVGHHPDDVGGAAQRVSVLQPVAVARQLAGHQVFPQPGRDALHAGVRLGGKQPLVEVEGVAPHGDAHQRGDPGRQPHQVVGAGIGEAGQRRHHRGAVHQCQPLFRSQGQGGDSQLLIDLGGGAQHTIMMELALPHQHGGDVGERRQIAAGPDGTLFRDARHQILLQQPAEPLKQRRADPGDSLRQRAEPGRQHGAGGIELEIRPQPAAVKAGQVQRQLGHQLGRHRPGHRVAVAGGHPVDDPLFGQQPVEKIGAPLDAGHEGGIRVEHGPGTAFGQGHHVFDGQRRGAEGDPSHLTLVHRSAARNQKS
ncbi:hypothetical protein D3C77_355340 [compost metagenome]